MAWRRGVLQRSSEATDPELAGVLRHVAARRRARGPGALATQATSGSAGAGEVLSIETVAPGIRIFRVARPSNFTFRAGQNLELGLPGVGKTRPYSIASAPHEPHLEFCIEQVASGRLTPSLFELRPGARLELGARPKGSFALAAQARLHLMVATVTGIAPLRSMLLDAIHRGTAARFLILHGASYADELPYRAELEALAASSPNVVYHPTVSRPTEARNRGWSGHTGRVDPFAIEQASSFDPSTTHAYACGNAGMVRNVRDALQPAGFPVSTEAFD